MLYCPSKNNLFCTGLGWTEAGSSLTASPRNNSNSSFLSLAALLGTTDNNSSTAHHQLYGAEEAYQRSSNSSGYLTERNNNISSSFFDKIDQRGRLGALGQSYDRRTMAADRSSSSLLPKAGGESFVDTSASYERGLEGATSSNRSFATMFGLGYRDKGADGFALGPGYTEKAAGSGDTMKLGPGYLEKIGLGFLEKAGRGYTVDGLDSGYTERTFAGYTERNFAGYTEKTGPGYTEKTGPGFAEKIGLKFTEKAGQGYTLGARGGYKEFNTGGLSRIAAGNDLIFFSSVYLSFSMWKKWQRLYSSWIKITILRHTLSNVKRGRQFECQIILSGQLRLVCECFSPKQCCGSGSG